MNEFWSSFLDLVFPSNIYCIHCGRPIDDSFPYSLCPSCVRSINWANKTTCDCCGKPMPVRSETGLCGECADSERVFDRGYTCAAYGMTERALIHKFKYYDQDYLADHFAELMVERIALEELKPDLVVPVPMYKEKERKRGYNQAALLAGSVARRLSVPCFPRLLARTSDTPPMSGQSAASRRKSVRDVFIVAKRVKNIIYGKTVLLVDDVFTTGSTAEACSAVLKEAGAHRVYVITFTAGMDTSRKV